MNSTPKHPVYLGILCMIFLCLLTLWILNFSNNKTTLGGESPYAQADLAEMAKIPKPLRPDIAAKQDIQATMDPALGRPTPERLIPILQAMDRYREYEESRATPGTSTNPWEERGPNNVGGRTRALMYDPNDATGRKVWAGGVTGGLWYNNDITNFNSSWIAVDDFWDNIAITTIAYDPNNTQVFYVGTGETVGHEMRGMGIWKTVNGGQSWQHLRGSSKFAYINDLVVRNENGTSTLYVAVDKSQNEEDTSFDQYLGVQRSADGGSTFSQVLPHIGGAAFIAADLELSSDNRLWIGTRNNLNGQGGGRILVSNNGINWQVLNTPTVPVPATRLNGRVELAIAPSNPTYIYAILTSNSIVKSMIYSTDGGVNWSTMNIPIDPDNCNNPTNCPSLNDFSRGQAEYDLILAVNPQSPNILYAGAINLFRTANWGTNWNQLSSWKGSANLPVVHADQHALVFKPDSDSEVLVGNDGGIYRVTNAHLNFPTFSKHNTNYNVTQFYTGAIHPTANINNFLAGSQDNGTQRFTQAGMNSTHEPPGMGGDGSSCFIDQNEPHIQIASYIFNNFHLSINGGQSFFSIQAKNDGVFINPADYDDRFNTLFSAKRPQFINRIRLTNNAVLIDSIQVRHPNNDFTSHFKASPWSSSSSTFFVGTARGNIFKITQANTNTPSTSEISTNSLPSRYISCIEIGRNENELLVTFSNYGTPSVWYTDDGGASWSNKEGNLPDMPVRWALFNPDNRSEVLLATELGVWSTTNFHSSSPRWFASNSGLSNVRVNMLQYRDSDKQIIAATFGRGLFSSNFSSHTNPSCTSLSSDYEESFETDLGIWTQNSDDDTNWTRRASATPSSSTGPSTAIDGSYFLYTEATGHFNEIATLTSECINLGEYPNPQLSFSYHMYGRNLGSLYVELSADEGSTWNTIWTKSGDQGNEWKLAEIDLSSYQNNFIQLRFRGEIGPGFRSDMAIDQLKITRNITSTPTLSITNPIGNSIWTSGSNQTLRWTSTNLSSSENISIRYYNGSSWSTLIASTPNIGSKTITAPAVSQQIDNARFRIYVISQPSVSVYSDKFTIQPPAVSKTLMITYPTSNDVWATGESRPIRWSSEGIGSSERVKIEYWNGFNWSIVTSSTPNDGSYTITVPHVSTTLYYAAYHISLISNPAIETLSESFTIVPQTLTITYPTNNDVWGSGETRPIRWASTGLSPSERVLIAFWNGTQWVDITTSTPNDGSYTIRVPDVYSPFHFATYYIRANSNHAIEDYSEYFTILPRAGRLANSNTSNDTSLKPPPKFRAEASNSKDKFAFNVFDVFPNPAKDQANIHYELDQNAHVLFALYDMHGRKVKNILNFYQKAGNHDFKWKTNSISEGLYSIQMIIDGAHSHTNRIQIIK